MRIGFARVIKRRAVGPSALAITISAFLALFAIDAAAQSVVYRGTDLGGLQRNHAYWSPSGFEHFDTKTGNLVLTHADLVLPGYNGRDLVFQRTFNNLKHPAYGPFATFGAPQNRWTFGFPGMVMRIIDNQSWPTYTGLATWETRMGNAPVFVMADGSFRRTHYEEWPGSQQHVISADFIKFDRQPLAAPDPQAGLRRLRMPDGRICHYDSQGRLVHFHDQFSNHVFLDYSQPYVIAVTQHVGTESRVVYLDLDGTFAVVAMRYLDRQWAYQRTGNTFTVVPPLGPSTVYEYNTGTGFLQKITLPTQGTIHYEYDTQSFQVGASPNTHTVYLPKRRILKTAQAQEVGTWTLTLTPQVVSSELWLHETVVVPPSGVSLRYVNVVSGSLGARIMGSGTGPVLTQLISEGSWFDQTATTYTNAAFGVGGSGAVVVSQTVAKHREPPSTAERTVTTTFGYSGTYVGAYANYQVPTSITEVPSDGPTRQIQRTHFYWNNNFYPYVIGRLGTETVTVGGVQVSSVSNQWTNGDLTWAHPYTSTVNGVVTTYSHDAYGNVATETTNGKGAAYGYSRGRLSSVQGEIQGVTLVRWMNPDGSVASETAGGLTTSFWYDALGRMTQMQAPGNGNAVITTYDNSSAAWVKTDRGTETSTTYLDDFGRAVRTLDGSGVEVQTQYDAESRVTAQSLPFTANAPSGGTLLWVTTEYDAIGRVKREGRPDPNEATLITAKVYTRYTYELTKTIVTDEQDRVTETTFDANGIATLKDPANSVWTYGYTAGRLTSITGPPAYGNSAPIARTWAYDANGRLFKETTPESGVVETEVFNAAGQVQQQRDARNTVSTYAYDANHRLQSVTVGSLTTTLTYKAGTDLIETTTASDDPNTTTDNIVTQFEYDSAHRPSKRIDTIDTRAFVTKYAYDANDRLSEITYPSGRKVRQTYDAQGRLARVYNVKTGQSYATNFTYHGSGAVLGFRGGNGVTTTVTLDPRRYRVKTIKAATVPASPLLELTYGYDTVGNVLTLNDHRANMNQLFQYDSLDRLKSAASPQMYTALTYEYDAHGNRTPTTGSNFEYFAGTFRLKRGPGMSTDYGYDNNGNLTTGPGFTYAYRPDNMMSSASVVGSSATSFKYDGGASRIKKSVTGGSTFYYIKGPDGQLLTEWEVTGSSQIARDYIYAGGQLLGVSKDTTPELEQP